MSEGIEPVNILKKKLKHIFVNVIMFGIIYYYAITFIIDMNDEVLVQDFELGMIMIALFTFLWCLDFKKHKLTKVVNFIVLMFIDLGMSFLLYDIADLMIYINESIMLGA